MEPKYFAFCFGDEVHPRNHPLTFGEPGSLLGCPAGT